MAVARDTRRWIRKVDGDMHIVAEQPVVRLYPTTLTEVVESVQEARDAPPGTSEARAIGSHWAMSETGVTPGFMIETASPVHEPDQPPTSKRLNNALFNVIPECLTDVAKEFFHRKQIVPTFDPIKTPTLLELYLFHVEAGMRIHELYSLIDKGDRLDDGFSLAHLMFKTESGRDYSGPWALETMGGAGGQTIAGAFSTGTHGGDLGLGALADQVVAVHLVDANCQQHWIERTRLRQGQPQMKLVDDSKLRTIHPQINYHNDDDLMNAVTVACGRMGVIYSVVLRVVRQYALDETRTQEDWNDVRQWISTPIAPAFSNRFVQMAINPYGHMFDPSRHTVYVNTRVLKPLNAAGNPPLGRQERGVNPGTNKHLGFTDDFFSGLCGSNYVISRALDQLLADTRDMRALAIKAWAVAAAVIIFPLTLPPIRAAAFAAQQTAAATIVWSSGMISLLWYLVKDALPPLGGRLSDEMSCVMNICADLPLGFFVIRFAMCQRHDSEYPQNNPNDPHTPAISYAAMDQHDYTNVGCVAPGDSIEVFFDRFDPQLVKFLDRVLTRVRDLENGDLTGGSEAFGGYISVRFMGQGEALLSMQRWPQTCAIEIAGLSKVDGTDPFIARIEADALAMGGLLHWGQRNTWEMKQVEKFYDPTGPNGRLFRWREVLSKFTEHGRHDVFSTAYSKQRGLEITKPRIQLFRTNLGFGCADEEMTVDWIAISNPPETIASLIVTPKDGNPHRITLATLEGSRKVPLGAGHSTLTLRLDREVHGAPFSEEQSIDIQGFGPGHDTWHAVFTAVPFVIDGQERWGVDINMSSSQISNKLRVVAIQSTFSGVPGWIVRNANVGDLFFTTTMNHLGVPNQPTFNHPCLVFATNPGTQGPSP